jgi:hypothetical protein
MKQLAVGVDNGYVNASIEDLISSKLNQFQGWHCQAGIQNLYIDFDGKVWISNCASVPNTKRLTRLGEAPWGYLGTIGTEFPLPQQGVICPLESCGCGSDVVITKWRNGHEPKTPRRFIPLENITKINSVKTNYEMPKQILWDISRRCNYDCSYCWPSVHNTTDPHLPLATLQQTSDYLIDQWANGGEIHWYFGGGEPTLNPDFEPFVEHLANRNQWIMLVSNASQGPSYWAKNANHYNTLIFSAHFEFMKPALFAKNYKQVGEVILNGATRLNEFIVKLMTKPGEIKQSIDFVNELKESVGYNLLTAGNKNKFGFDMVPLRSINDGSKLHPDYTDSELQEILEFNKK